MISRTLIAALAACALSCAAVKPEQFVDKGADVRADVGYVAAFFSIEAGVPTFLIGIQDPVGRTFDLAFRDPSAPAAVDLTHLANRGISAGSRQLGMVALPPGDYRIAHWRLDDVGADSYPRSVSRTHPMGKPFAVRPGHVVFLGSFTARQTFEQRRITTGWQTGTVVITTSTVEPQPLAADEAWMLFTDTYPRFAEAPVECLLCGATGGRPRAAPALPESGGFTRSPDVTLHLRRSAGTPTTCTLLAWESFAGKRDRRAVVNASRRWPLHSTEDEHGGPSWTLNALDFANGQVNFQVRGCDPELKRPIEGTWNLSQGREAWIDERDPTIRFSPAEAHATEAAE